MNNKLLLKIILLFIIVLVIICLVNWPIYYKKSILNNTGRCFKNWNCNAPENNIEIFNALNPNSCEGSDCDKNQKYNVFDKGPLSSNFKEICSTDKPLNDSNYVVVNNETGCLCGTCTVQDLVNKVEGCHENCGLLARSCGTFKIKIDEDNNIPGMSDWLCSPTSSNPLYKEYCSFICPNNSHNNDFFNNFIFGFRKDE